MLELAVALVVRRWRLGRGAASAAVAAACFVAGLGTVYSLEVFEALDHLTSNILLPVGGFALAVFAGWVLPRAVLVEELKLGPRGAALLGVLLRWVTPALIAASAAGTLY
jgi:NSS family neurotransmitter:Na+ symporter